MRTLNRRTLIELGAMITGVALAQGASRAAAAGAGVSPPLTAAGVVQRLDIAELALRSGGRTRLLRLLPRAQVNRDGRVGNGAFAAGDEAVAVLASSGAASAVFALYRSLEGTISSIDRDFVVVSGGKARLSEQTIVRRAGQGLGTAGRGALRPGQYVSVKVLRAPDGELHARLIGIGHEH